MKLGAAVNPLLSRRAILAASAGLGAALVAFDPRARAWLRGRDTPRLGAAPAPALEGVLLADDASRERFAIDAGRNARRVPTAVLVPASDEDVVRMVGFANRHDLRIGMRGVGHSVYGQSLVEAGVAIDSRGLRAVRMAGADEIDAMAGATWGEVAKVALAHRRMPPVMPDWDGLTVGGTLSVGGFSPSIHRFGMQVDTVTELEVVTGDGRRLICSTGRESDLFHAVLAGLGQCGLILRARLALVPSHSHWLRLDLHYDALAPFVADQLRFAADGPFDHLTGRIAVEADGRWAYRLIAGIFCTPPEIPAAEDLTRGLHHRAHSQAVLSPYESDYLQRGAREFRENVAAGRIASTAHGADQSLWMWLPASSAVAFVAAMQAEPDLFRGAPELRCAPLVRSRLTCPLAPAPEEELALGVWFFRSAPRGDTATAASMQRANRTLLARMREAGGRGHPSHVPYASRTEWQAHFGAAWAQLAAAKARYDPNAVLTPGPGVF